MGVFCQIHLQRPPNGVYKPGNSVTGAVQYAVDEDSFYKDIIVCLRGKGIVNWTEGSTGSKTEYWGYETYVNAMKSVLDKKTDDEVLVKAGVYSSTFHFVLPYNIPSSYKDYFCRILYYVKLYFVRKGLFKFNKVFRTEIPVVSNNITLRQEPIIYGSRMSVMAPFSSTKNEINLKATIEKSTLAPCEAVDLDIKVTNDSNVKISRVKTKLITDFIYTAEGGHKKYVSFEVKEAKSETEAVEKRCTASLKSTVKIPENVYTIQHSRLFVRDYKLRLEAKIPFPHLNLKLDIPILVGEADVESDTEIKDCSFDPEPLSDDAPPSYWEVMAEDKLAEKE